MRDPRPHLLGFHPGFLLELDPAQGSIPAVARGGSERGSGGNLERASIDRRTFPSGTAGGRCHRERCARVLMSLEEKLVKPPQAAFETRSLRNQGCRR